MSKEGHAIMRMSTSCPKWSRVEIGLPMWEWLVADSLCLGLNSVPFLSELQLVKVWFKANGLPVSPSISNKLEEEGPNFVFCIIQGKIKTLSGISEPARSEVGKSERVFHRCIFVRNKMRKSYIFLDYPWCRYPGSEKKKNVPNLCCKVCNKFNFLMSLLPWVAFWC